MMFLQLRLLATFERLIKHSVMLYKTP